MFVPLPALRLRTLLPTVFRNRLGRGGRQNPSLGPGVCVLIRGEKQTMRCAGRGRSTEARRGKAELGCWVLGAGVLGAGVLGAGFWGEPWLDPGVEAWNGSTAYPGIWEDQPKFSSFGFECNVLFSCRILHFTLGPSC